MELNFRSLSLPVVHEPSIKSLFCELRFGDRVLSTGTGFVVQKGGRAYLLTNRHNVTGRHQETGECLSDTKGTPDNIVIHHHVTGRLGEWVGRGEQLYEEDGKARWREHPQYGARADVVALPLTNLDGVQLYPYDLADFPNVAIGPSEVVSVVGFPFGMSTGGFLPIWATGFVASEPEVKTDGKDLPIFFIDCRSRPGQSGSAVVAYRNGGTFPMVGGGTVMYGGPVTKLLGIYSGRVNPESDIGIVWKTSVLIGLIDDQRELIAVTVKLSQPYKLSFGDLVHAREEQANG